MTEFMNLETSWLIFGVPAGALTSWVMGSVALYISRGEMGMSVCVVPTA